MTINQSHGGSSKQARSVLDGLEADVVTMNQPLDVNILATKGKLIPEDWASRLPNRSVPYSSTILFLVRRGNPQKIKDWDDLIRAGVSVVLPNPKTLGSGRYSFLAAWGYAEKKFGGDKEKAREFVTKLLANVPVLDAGGRGATVTFAQRGIGDVLLTFENEALGAEAEFGRGKFDLVAPSVSVLAENPVTWVDRSVTRHKSADLARAYLEFLFGEQGQELAAFPVQTIWATAPRLEADVQSPAWLRKGQFVQGTAASQIDGLGVAAAASSSSQATGPNNTTTGVVIPKETDFAISPLLGAVGDLVGTFQGSSENLTADDFDGDPSNVSRADLYELVPGTTAGSTLNTPGRWLGYFELKADGTLSFSAGVVTVAQPNNTGVVREGNVTKITFSSLTGTNYRLRRTAAFNSGAPVSSWTTGATVQATGSTLTLEDANDGGAQFYAIETQP